MQVEDVTTLAADKNLIYSLINRIKVGKGGTLKTFDALVVGAWIYPLRCRSGLMVCSHSLASRR